MRTKQVISIAALGTSIAVLASCGGGGGDTVVDAGTQNPPATQPTTPSTGSTPTTPTPSNNVFAYVVQAATNASSVAAGTTYTGGSILKCAVNASGDLTACSTSGMPAVNNPISLAFSGSSAFILNQTAPKLAGSTGIQYAVLKCTVGTDGALSNCADTSPGVSTETDFASRLIATANSGYALKEQQLLKCPSGFAGACGTDSGSVAFPASVVASDMLAADNRIFVVNAGSGTTPGSILSWNTDATSGALSAASTTVTDASFATALRIDETTVDAPNSIAIKAPFSYILTRYANKVVQCSFNSAANTMTACAETTPLAGLSGITPKNIVVQGNFAYITDTSSTAAGNSIVKCTIGAADGKLGACAAIPGLTFTSDIVGIVLR
ncbi:hypothetical protein [Noviherbaspirillum denitrificans]|uniref:Uncharacterized protein n=1 Tax=Noviherbaspirillum denitrificans TaxID=1968433 RepID=A0A254TEU8_9BURK|nr:hypothetical protein [Noviherbaspirillum denitrificans]OWW20687.1 hypothetical protein AYR66_15535 [Noviherbaspirillum denitrificans]